jgi:hypothetical protein
MNHYFSLSLTNRKSSVHLHALYSHRTALRAFTPHRDLLVICGQYIPWRHVLTQMMSVGNVVRRPSVPGYCHNTKIRIYKIIIFRVVCYGCKLTVNKCVRRVLSREEAT